MARNRSPVAPDAGDATAIDLTVRLRIALARINRRLRQQDGEVDLTASQASVLAIVAARGPLTVGELGQLEHVRPPTITRMVDRLEERSLVVRRHDPSDRRVALVELTPDGAALLTRSRAQRSKYLERRLEALDDADRAAVIAALPALERLAEEP